MVCQDDKQLVITDGEAVLSKPTLLDLALLAPCSHEEADSRMLLHVSHAANHGHHNILIKTVDTDVVVLAVSVAQGLLPEDEQWKAFGTGKSFRYLAAHEIAAGLGPGAGSRMTRGCTIHTCRTKLPKAAHSCYELVSCKCKKRCVKRCKCKKAALECTALCVCVRWSAHKIERTQTELTLSLI